MTTVVQLLAKKGRDFCAEYSQADHIYVRKPAPVISLSGTLNTHTPTVGACRFMISGY